MIPVPDRNSFFATDPVADPVPAETPERRGERLPSWLRQWHGPLTQELVQHPAQFGLGQLPAGQLPDTLTTMVCGYCSTGCGLNIHLRDGAAIGLSPAADYPVNLGMACPKGWEALTVLRAPDRAEMPLIRPRGGEPRPASWDAAMRLFCDRFQEVQRRHGPDSLAFLSTGQIATEEMALLGCLAKFGMGMRHGDGNTRQCMATAAVAYKEAFGFDSPPFTYADFEESDVIVLIGSNLCIAHPILWQRVLRNRRKPKIVVIDPRNTETAQGATLHVPLRPKSDLSLLYGLAQLILENNGVDLGFIRAHTVGFAEFQQHLAAFTLPRVVADTGISAPTLQQLAAWIQEGPRTSFWWTMGVNQSYEGVRTAQAIINLALMTGNIGRPGTGANSITGQCNAMGSRLFSNTTNLIGGHDFQSAEHRTKIATRVGIDASRIPTQNSWAYDQIIDGIRQDRIKGLWVIATNTAHSWFQHDLREILGKLDFLVVQDMYHTTETAQLADLVLPAAAWGEKEGTFINSERRIGLMKKVARAPGQALADFSIFKLVAEYWGCGELFARWTDPEATFQILKEISRGQPCDISGIVDYRQIDEWGGIQWPFTNSEFGVRNAESNSEDAPHSTFRTPHSEFVERRLFADGRFFHADGKARFLFAEPAAMPEPPCGEYPLILLTGRGTASQWHTQSRTEKSAVLRRLYPSKLYVEMHPVDAHRLGIVALDRVTVASRRGELTATALITPTIQPGQVFLPMHYAETNRLTLWHIDPYSRQPSYKDCAVRVARGECTMSSFSPEQKQYLQGFVAGTEVARGMRGMPTFAATLAAAGSAGSLDLAEQSPPTAESIHRHAQDRFLESGQKLTPEEQAKRDQNPFEMWDAMRASADASRFPKGTDVFLYKFHGLFYVAPAQNSYMCRLRLPGGIVSAPQLQGIADIAEQWGGGFADVTTRANLQIREIRADDGLHVVTGLADLGILTRGSGADNIRNITGSPTAGIDDQELIDTRPLCREMHHYILQHRELYGLPRKFNIAFDGGGRVSAVADTNDIGFLAVRVGSGQDVPAGVYFRLELGGITGHGDFSRDTGLLLTPRECVETAGAMVRVFIERGDRTDRKKARLKYVLDQIGIEKFLELTEQKLGRSLRRFPLELCESRGAEDRLAHIGVHAQKQPGLCYLGVVLPVGRMTSPQMRGVARIAQRYGRGTIRLTVWQNLLISDVPREDVVAVQCEVEQLGLHWSTTNVRAGLIACTGNGGCRFAASNTKQHGLQIAEYLESRVTLDQPLNIHLTGCHHSCAQHYIGDIGLLATKVAVGDEMLEGYHLYIGGGYGEERGIGRELLRNLPFDEVPPAICRLVLYYLDRRADAHETFRDYVRRVSTEELLQQLNACSPRDSCEPVSMS